MIVESDKGLTKEVKNLGSRGFPGGPEVKNLPANTGDTDSVPGPGEIPHAAGQKKHMHRNY